MKMSMRQLMLIICLLFLTLGINAAQVFSWPDCIELAEKHNPDLVLAQEKIVQAQENFKILDSTKAFQVSSSVTARRAGSSTNSGADNYSVSVSGQKLIYDGLKTQYNLEASAKRYKASQLSYRSTEAVVRFRLRTAFINLWKEQKLREIAKEISERRQKNLELVELRYKAGREHKGAVLTAQANLARAEYEVVVARRNLWLLQKKLADIMGKDDIVITMVKENFEIRKIKEEKGNFKELVNRNADVQELVFKREAAEQDVKAAEANYGPRINANTSLGRSYADASASNSWSVGLSGSLSLYDGDSKKASLDKTKSVLNQVLIEEKKAKESVFYTLMETWVKLNNRLDQLEVQGKYLRATKERAKIADAQYSTGLLTFDNWTIIEDDLAQAKKVYLEVKANVWLAKAAFIQAKGGILDEG